MFLGVRQHCKCEIRRLRCINCIFWLIMRLEWLEDILAVAETGSMIRAAEQRFLTQSAFSRRLRMIEQQLGVELFDRSRKPAELRPTVKERCNEMRSLADSLRRLHSDLRHGSGLEQTRIVIASQHAITTAIAPLLVQAIVQPSDIDIRLRSANREDCYALLLTRQADFMLFYSTERHPLAVDRTFIETCLLEQEELVPVFAKHAKGQLLSAIKRREVPVVLYPRDVFLGKVVRDEIWPRLDFGMFKSRAETALTVAALQFALMGEAVAWLPRSLARSHLDRGDLEDFSGLFGFAEIELNVARLNVSSSNYSAAIWEAFVTKGQSHLQSVMR